MNVCVWAWIRSVRCFCVVCARARGLLLVEEEVMLEAGAGFASNLVGQLPGRRFSDDKCMWLSSEKA